MPELPEVETVRRGLEKYIVGYKIISVAISLPRIVTGCTDNILTAVIISVKRFGKGLVIELDNGYSLAIHIKMTGQLIYQGEETKDLRVSPHKVGTVPNKWTHVIFTLHKLNNGISSSAQLYYNDIRQFGWIKIIKSDDVKELSFFRSLGPEPLKDLTFEKFSQIISSNKTKIKPLLMDQSKIAGIGNIYANDALYLAQIMPTRPANSLNRKEEERLFHSIEQVLKKGLETGGASELTYVNAVGQEGGYQNHFQIYGKEGRACRICGTIIKKTVVGGRGTFYCSVCQK